MYCHREVVERLFRVQNKRLRYSSPPFKLIFAEWMNPGGSVKDRAAKYLVTDAEKKGALKPGGTVVEGTAGNTGIGLAHMCRARGYKCIIYIPETQSKEKMDALRFACHAFFEALEQ